MPRRRRYAVIAGACLTAAMVALPSAAGSSGGHLLRVSGSNAAVSSETTTTLAFGGDLLLGAEVNSYVARHGVDAPLAGVPQLRDADVAIVNLEGVVAPGADVVDTGNAADYYFLGRPEMLAVLEAEGIDLVSTANNHARDYGTAALAAQDQLLTAMGMPHPGIGREPAAACAPAYVAHGDLTIAVFSINTAQPAYAADGEIGTCHVAPDDDAGWRRIFGPAFTDARTRADVLVAMPHFRASLSNVPDPADRTAARLLVDLGADAVLGSGSHKLQGMEAHNGRPILHSAGSLVFNFPDADEGAVFILDLDPNGVRAVRTVPLYTELAYTRPATAVESVAILASMDTRSKDLDTVVTGGVLELDPPPRDRPTDEPDHVSGLDPGPAPGPVVEPPPACSVATVPPDAAIEPRAVGPLTITGARVDRERVDARMAIWLETYWRLDEPTTSDLWIAPRAMPERGAPWQAAHEPCDWAWPTSRWEPGVTYRDRYPLRPTGEVLRLGGLPALLTMTGYGPLAISVEVQDQGRSVGESGVLTRVTLDPAMATQLGIVGAVVVAVVLVLAVLAWRGRAARRRAAGHSP